MVVLVGSGHVAYDVGIVRQARRWFDGGIATVVPVAVALPNSDKVVEQVRASFADFVWGVMPEQESPYPRLGISTRNNKEGRRVILQVEEGSAAERAGLAMDDVLLSMDGHALDDHETLSRLIARKAWGDSARIVVRRGAEEKTLTAFFRRAVPRIRPAAPAARAPEAPPAPPAGPPVHDAGTRKP
jgi:S1-C subfamily serine protease